MKGADEYCNVFSKPEQFGKLFLYPSSHARGSTFDIWVLPSDEKCTVKPWAAKNSIKVYGPVSGNLGWTEVYGWIHKGRWCKDFEIIFASRKELLNKKKIESDKKSLSRKKEEEGHDNALLDNY